MIELPVQKRSAKPMNPKRGLIQIIHSSDKRDKCIKMSDAAEQNSILKSRSETASKELRQRLSKPSSLATMTRSMGKLVPAKAAAPRGSLLTRLRQSFKRSVSRLNISA